MALKTASVDRVAEFAFVVSRPAAESKAVLDRGRSEFTEAARQFMRKSLSPDAIKQLFANEAALLIAILENAMSGVSPKS